MPDSLKFRFLNKSKTQYFTVEDLVDKPNNPIWTGDVKGNDYSPYISCVIEPHGPGWGKVSVIGDDPRPDKPMVKDIRGDKDEFNYVP
jgi:hypothetical protein